MSTYVKWNPQNRAMLEELVSRGGTIEEIAGRASAILERKVSVKTIYHACERIGIELRHRQKSLVGAPAP